MGLNFGNYNLFIKKIIIFFFLFIVVGCNTPQHLNHKKNIFIKEKIIYNKLIKQPSIQKENYTKVLKLLTKNLQVNKNNFGETSPLLIKDYNNISSFYQFVKDYDNALKYLEKSSKLSEKIFTHNHIETAMSYKNIGFLYKRMGGNYEKALKSFQKSLKINKSILKNNHPYVLDDYINIGLIYCLMGNYPKALEFYKQANDNQNIGKLYYLMGNYKKALKYYDKSLNKKGLSIREKSKIYSNKGMVYYALDNYFKALHFHKESLKYGEFPLIIKAELYNNIGITYYAKGEYNQAIDFLKKSLSLEKEYITETHPLIAQNFYWIGLTYLKLKSDIKAKKNLESSLRIKEKTLNKEHIELAISYQSMGLFYKEKRKFQKAFEFYLKAFEIYQKNINRNFTILNTQMKSKYKKTNKTFILDILDILSKNKNKNTITAVFNDWLNYKRTIFDYETNLKILNQKTEDKITKNNINKLFHYQQMLSKISGTQLFEEVSLKNYNKKLDDLSENILKLEIILSKKLQNIASKKIIYTKLVKDLKTNELYIDFAKIENNYYVFTLDKKNTITFNRISKKDSETIDTIIKTELKRKRIDKIKKSYAKLYKLLFKNIYIKNKTSLIISPDGLLSILPFEALYIESQGEYLIEKVNNIRYIPSGKELVKLYDKNNHLNKKNDKVVVFANINYGLKINNNKNKTKGTVAKSLEKAYPIKDIDDSKELKIIKDKYGEKCQLFLEENASKENFLKLKSPKILHLSTHGFYFKNSETSNPMLKSIIVFSGVNNGIKNHTGEGIVTGLELSGLNLNDTELVVLSACNTGIGEIVDGEGVAGINKAFMRAGAKYIIMTLWNVDQNATGTLMEYFYKNINNHQSYSIALKNAKISMIRSKTYSNPLFWAGFVGSGRDRTELVH